MKFANDNQETLYVAAQAYLKRHQCEYLGEDQILFSRAVNHLIAVFGAPMLSAEQWVGRAYGELRQASCRHRLDRDASGDEVAVITDASSGLTWAIPVSLICSLIIQAPHTRRLRLDRT